MKRIKRENVPGPGQYTISGTSKTSIRFGTEKRDKKAREVTPGPGQYHIPCSIVDVPRYLMAGGGFNTQFRYI